MAIYDETSPAGIRVFVDYTDYGGDIYYVVDDYAAGGDTDLGGTLYPGDEEPGETLEECAVDIGAAVAENEFDDYWHR